MKGRLWLMPSSPKAWACFQKPLRCILRCCALAVPHSAVSLVLLAVRANVPGVAVTVRVFHALVARAPVVGAMRCSARDSTEPQIAAVDVVRAAVP